MLVSPLDVADIDVTFDGVHAKYMVAARFAEEDWSTAEIWKMPFLIVPTFTVAPMPAEMLL